MYFWSKFAQTFSKAAQFQIWSVLTGSGKNATWRTKLSLAEECIHETPETLLDAFFQQVFKESTTISSSRCANWISKNVNTNLDKFKICHKSDGPQSVINASVNAFNILSVNLFEAMSMCILPGWGISQKTGSNPLLWAVFIQRGCIFPV